MNTQCMPEMGSLATLSPGRMMEAMSPRFDVGDHLRWNSETGHVSGVITEVHTEDFAYKGHTRRASNEEPQYEIKSDRTDHVAAHKGSALHLVEDD